MSLLLEGVVAIPEPPRGPENRIDNAPDLESFTLAGAAFQVEMSQALLSRDTIEERDRLIGAAVVAFLALVAPVNWAGLGFKIDLSHVGHPIVQAAAAALVVYFLLTFGILSW